MTAREARATEVAEADASFELESPFASQADEQAKRSKRDKHRKSESKGKRDKRRKADEDKGSKGKRHSSHKSTQVAVFRYAYYAPLFKYFVEQVLDCEYVPLGKPTKHTMELGIRSSSDYVCTPFKHMMGDWIEALERGANLLVQVGGPCRLGFYGEMQERILRDMGYDFTMLNFSHGIEQGYLGWGKEVLKAVNPDINIPFGARQLLACAKMMEGLDAARDFYLENAAFELETGSFKRTWEAFLGNLNACTDARQIEKTCARALEELRAIPLDKPSDCVRIGIVGEFYTAIDENSNLGLEEKLIGLGAELHRDLNFSNRYLHYDEKSLRRSISEYAEYDMGPTSSLTLNAAKKYAMQGFDGIVHAKCAGCTPEIDCMPVLRRISEDFDIPILYLTYDTETSDTGLMTRLEAFYDMLAMRKKHGGALRLDPTRKSSPMADQGNS